MNPIELTLQDLVQWSLSGALLWGMVLIFFRVLARRKRKCELRQHRRRCAQCGLLQESQPGEPKYGTCEMCGGVTSRGRSRKLG